MLAAFRVRARAGSPAKIGSDRTVMLNERRDLNNAGHRGLASHTEEWRDARDTSALNPAGLRSTTEERHAPSRVHTGAATGSADGNARAHEETDRGPLHPAVA